MVVIPKTRGTWRKIAHEVCGGGNASHRDGVTVFAARGTVTGIAVRISSKKKLLGIYTAWQTLVTSQILGLMIIHRQNKRQLLRQSAPERWWRPLRARGDLRCELLDLDKKNIVGYHSSCTFGRGFTHLDTEYNPLPLILVNGTAKSNPVPLSILVPGTDRPLTTNAEARRKTHPQKNLEVYLNRLTAATTRITFSIKMSAAGGILRAGGARGTGGAGAARARAGRRRRGWRQRSPGCVSESGERSCEYLELCVTLLRFVQDKTSQDELNRHFATFIHASRKSRHFLELEAGELTYYWWELSSPQTDGLTRFRSMECLITLLGHAPVFTFHELQVSGPVRVMRQCDENSATGGLI
ncbi:hypothetical protein EVAR_77457_1 [Eumeta japonica]|uniref:Uncharacterized protein n=1 Tax=Eumeta variegata TaxID=151549 RepID=A0A4C1ZUI8_EUMVA|nr:hypothetical protein EVAR_77457_1 [Eumeta japonica]